MKNQNKLTSINKNLILYQKYNSNKLCQKLQKIKSSQAALNKIQSKEKIFKMKLIMMHIFWLIMIRDQI